MRSVSRWAWGAMAVSVAVYAAGLSLVAQGGQASGRRPAVAGAGQGGGINGIQSSEAGADFSPKPPVQPLSPKEEQARFILPPGYHLELVLSEPDVISPGQIAFVRTPFGANWTASDFVSARTAPLEAV